MKKLFGLIIVLLVFVGIAFKLMSENKDKVSYSLEGSDFTVDSSKDINKIFLAYKNKPSVKLERVNGDWILNDKYKAENLIVNNLLTVFTRAKVSYIPPKQAVKNIFNGIGVFGIKVELFDKKDQILKSFYIGGNNNNETATFFLMSGVKQPYAMHLTSIEGNLRDRFMLDASDWRDRTIFGDLKKDISSIKVVYPKQKSISFVMNIKDDKIEVLPYFETTTRVNKPLNKSNIENYFLDIEERMSESIIDGYEKQDSISNLIGFCEVEVNRKDGTSRKIKFVPMHDDLQRGFGGVESNRFFGVSDNGDLLLTQNRVIKGFFKTYESFFMY